MKTPDEIKKDALALIRQTDASYRQLSKALCGKENATLEEVLQVASQLKNQLQAYEESAIKCCYESRCNKEINALNEYCDQRDKELEAVKRERDAAKSDLCNAEPCFTCLHFRRNGGDCGGGSACREAMWECIKSNREYTGNVYEWRGVCPENTEVQEDD